MKTKDSLDSIVASIPSLVPFTAQEKRILSNLLHLRQFAVHEEIYPAYSPTAAAYYIIEGSVGLFQAEEGNIPERIAYFRPQQWFGYSALLNDDLRDSGTKALEPTRCLALFRTDYIHLAEQDSACALKIVTNICFDLLHNLKEIQKDYFSLTRKLTRANILI